MPTCNVNGCTLQAVEQGLCIEHCEAMSAADEPPPQARGGRRRQRPLPDYPPPVRTATGQFAPGSTGNPYGAPRPVVELRLLARTMTPEAFHTLRKIHLDPKAPAQARAYAANKLIEHGIGTAPMAVFHDHGGQPAALADGEITPLVRIAAGVQGADYESNLRRDRQRIDTELNRLEDEREQARAAKEKQMADARAAKANGRELPPALALLLRVRDEPE